MLSLSATSGTTLLWILPQNVECLLLVHSRFVVDDFIDFIVESAILLLKLLHLEGHLF